jgi:ribosomal protein S18 acetylase RimI-like enzyme
VERIARLHVLSWQATYTRELSPEFLAGMDLESRCAAWRSQLEQGVAVSLAEDGSELLGFVASGPVRDPSSNTSTVWEIYNLHVAPRHHGHGFGSELFEDAARLGREAGAIEMLLWVVSTNNSARAFYEHKRMRYDGGLQEQDVGRGELLREVRYRMRLDVGA